MLEGGHRLSIQISGLISITYLALTKMVLHIESFHASFLDCDEIACSRMTSYTGLKVQQTRYGLPI